MIEQIQLKRGLLRLREVTVAELAGYADVAPATVKSFLHDHPNLVVESGSAPPTGPGRPATVWKLRPEAETPLIEELRELRRAADPEFAREATDNANSAKNSVAVVLSALEGLVRDRKSTSAEKLAAAGRRLKRRIAATQVALRDLKNAGREVIVEESALDRASGELDRLLAPDISVDDNVIDAAREAVERYLGDWFAGMRRKVPNFVNAQSFSPTRIAAAPLLLIDCIATPSDSLSKQVVAAGTAMGAPVLHLAVGDLSQDQRRMLFRQVGSCLALAGGAATQVVYTIDSSDSKSALGLAQDFAVLEGGRDVMDDAVIHEPSHPLARQVVTAVAPLVMGIGVAAASYSAVVPVIQATGAASFVLAGMLDRRRNLDTSKDSDDAQLGAPDFVMHWHGHLHSVCVDQSSKLQLGSIFDGTRIDYVRASSFSSVGDAFRGPLRLYGKPFA